MTPEEFNKARAERLARAASATAAETPDHTSDTETKEPEPFKRRWSGTIVAVPGRETPSQRTAEEALDLIQRIMDSANITEIEVLSAFTGKEGELAAIITTSLSGSPRIRWCSDFDTNDHRLMVLGACYAITYANGKRRGWEPDQTMASATMQFFTGPMTQYQNLVAYEVFYKTETVPELVEAAGGGVGLPWVASDDEDFERMVAEAESEGYAVEIIQTPAGRMAKLSKPRS